MTRDEHTICEVMVELLAKQSDVAAKKPVLVIILLKASD